MKRLSEYLNEVVSNRRVGKYGPGEPLVLTKDSYDQTNDYERLIKLLKKIGATELRDGFVMKRAYDWTGVCRIARNMSNAAPDNISWCEGTLYGHKMVMVLSDFRADGTRNAVLMDIYNDRDGGNPGQITEVYIVHGRRKGKWDAGISDEDHTCLLGLPDRENRTKYVQKAIFGE